MRLLVSVTDAAEARVAVEAGVDIVDVKNPAEGSLGAPGPGVIEQVREVVPPERPVSAAIGDLPNLPGTAALAALGAASSGAAYVKVGLWGTPTTDGAVAVLRAVRDAVDGGATVIAASYADAERVPGGPLPPGALVSAARRAGVAGCLLDTAVKDGRGLFEWLSPEDLDGAGGRGARRGPRDGARRRPARRGPGLGPGDRRRHRRRARGRLPRRPAHGAARRRANRAAANAVRELSLALRFFAAVPLERLGQQPSLVRPVLEDVNDADGGIGALDAGLDEREFPGVAEVELVKPLGLSPADITGGRSARRIGILVVSNQRLPMFVARPLHGFPDLLPGVGHRWNLSAH